MNKKLILNSFYLLIGLTIFSAIFQILDFRLNKGQFFSLINKFVVIILISFVIVYIFKNYFKLNNKIKHLYSINLLFIYYLIIRILCSCIRTHNIESVVLSIKNLVLPYILLIFFIMISADIKNFNPKKLYNIINFAGIINITLVFIGFSLGWEITTKYVLGRSYYALDIYCFGHSGSMLRVPGLFQDALTQGSFSFLVFIINYIKFKTCEQNKKIYYIIFTLIGLLGMLLSTNRQIIFALGIYFLLVGIIKFRKVAIFLLSWLIPFIIYLISLLSNLNIDIFSLKSLFYRFDSWSNILNNMNLEQNPFNILWGVGVNASILEKINNKVTNLDNSYLLIFNDFGLIGVVLLVALLFNIIRYLINYSNDNEYVKIGIAYTIYFIVRMFFHNSIINEYESYIFILVIISSILCINTSVINKEYM